MNCIEDLFDSEFKRTAWKLDFWIAFHASSCSRHTRSISSEPILEHTPAACLQKRLDVPRTLLKDGARLVRILELLDVIDGVDAVVGVGHISAAKKRRWSPLRCAPTRGPPWTSDPSVLEELILEFANALNIWQYGAKA